jgi:putative polyhydroxyalkanoic acid system protein
MPSLEVTVPHVLPVEDATQRVRVWFEKLVEQNQREVKDMNVAWDHAGATFSFKAHGITVSGALKVASDEVTIDAKIPFIALGFRPQIKGFLEGALARELEA